MDTNRIPCFNFSHTTLIFNPFVSQTFILWVGWYGFNSGSVVYLMQNDNYEVVSHVAINTTLAAASGAVMALLIDTIVQEHNTGEVTFNLSYAMNGCLAGLVSITAGCAVVQSWASLIIGAIGAALFLGTSKLLVKRCVDDAVDAVPVHVSLAWIYLSCYIAVRLPLTCCVPAIKFLVVQWNMGIFECWFPG